ncbi:MAG: hypothetical protein WBP16_03805 [Ferruginibacter sp.]
MKKDFNQCQQSWWKIIEITTAIPLFFNILQKLLHWTVFIKKVLVKEQRKKTAVIINYRRFYFSRGADVATMNY